MCYFLSLYTNVHVIMIIHMKKLLNFDWLGAVQLKCNTSANFSS